MQRSDQVAQARLAPMPATDAILPVTRIVAAILVPFLVLAFLILYLQPENTGEHFAWTIVPAMTPMIMGSGYLAGGYYFIRLALGRRWHNFGVVLPTVSIFAALIMIATIIHWDRFNHDHVAFYLWVILYAVAPPLVFGLWLVNRRQDPGQPAAGELIVPVAIRRALFVSGVIILLIAGWLYFAPDSAADSWPWALSPATARTTAAWFVLGGSASLMLAGDSRWSAWKIPIETTLLWALLILLAIPRASNNFDWDRAASWIFVAAVVSWVGSFAALLIAMEWRRRRLSKV